MVTRSCRANPRRVEIPVPWPGTGKVSVALPDTPVASREASFVSQSGAGAPTDRRTARFRYRSGQHLEVPCLPADDVPIPPLDAIFDESSVQSNRRFRQVRIRKLVLNYRNFQHRTTG